MKRNLELVRLILIEVEKKENTFGRAYFDIDIPGYSKEEIWYHVMIMEQAELLTAKRYGRLGDLVVRYYPQMLTWKGHEFLANAKNDRVWTEALKRLSGNLATVSFDVLASLLTQIAHQLLLRQ